MWRSSDAHWGCRPTSVEIQRESGIQSFASWLASYPTSSLAVWVMRNSLVPQRRIQVRYVTVTKMRGYSCTAEVPVVSVSAVVEEFPSRFHLPYPDRDHTSQSLLAERLSTSTLEPIAQQLISLITDIMDISRLHYACQLRRGSPSMAGNAFTRNAKWLALAY